ncbi:ShlB/FhaC/HecB family hemolysin secretion/activation protein [Nitrogeniibacter aestuarii]|uniref:ShlB/FhaC/HecB family hemolysin secretion/activation protein n=1 Tax=Nitrogeniibacter aestuarii TaxID=2815343 RepID=UPI001D1263D9|nr:ShlB/FhaC/HecB family hemolysin secretion/activation protein [Nitrogeniibacter aestuarii]
MPNRRSATWLRHVCALVFFWSALSLAQGLPERFILTEIQVKGNTVLPQTTVERAIYPFLGPDKSEADMLAARDALAAAYEAEGYLSVQVRPVAWTQQARDAFLFTFEVTEASIERVRVKGAEYNLPSEIRAEAESIAPGKVPHFPSLQEDLGRLQRRADMSVTPVLRPGRDPGRMEVELQVEDTLPLHGSIELSNRQSADTSARRLEAAVRYDNLWQAQHSIGLRFINSPLDTDQVEVYSLVYGMPLGGQGRRLTVFAVESNSNVVTAQDFGSQGNGITVGLRYSIELPARQSGLFHSVSAGIDYKHLKETSGLVGADRSDKPVIYMPLALQYNAALPGGDRTWVFGVGSTIGLRGLTDNNVDCDGIATVDQFECRRAGANRNFMTGRVDLGIRQSLGQWRLNADLASQFASGPLISSEQFAVGGVDSVRGYLEAEALGDDGARLGLQLTSPGFAPKAWPLAVNALAFYETGWVHVQESLDGQVENQVLAGVGVGLRAKAGKFLSATMDYAHALRDGPQTRKGDDRLHVSVGLEF